MGGCGWFVVLVAIVAGLLAKASHDYGGLDNAFYETLPYMPAEIFQAIGSLGVRFITCEGRPLVPFLRTVGIVSEELDCFEGEGLGANHLVIGSTVKGGSIMSARLFISVAMQCNICVGYGFRPNGYWPPPTESIPSYDSDGSMAIAFVEGWSDYAMRQVGQDKDRIKCVFTVRNPWSRLVSMFLYFESAGEYDLRDTSAKIRSFHTTDEKTKWVWNEIGKETMVRTHKYLVDSIDFGCHRLRFEDFGKDFNNTARVAFSAWGIHDPSIQDKLLLPVQKLDLSQKSKSELEKDHHHTASKFPPGYKQEVIASFTNIPDVVKTMQQQALDLGY